ncbi:LLM class flavin-dependent oxidoreductase [Kineococcus rhizosphaerae]|uniref:Luciferase family oxidoreductase group 1 n=1 Tax=Kineococcus rhizosphaerae TaxID=559628 RepID=A0A2T0RBD0_9ACTN|nr:LLM class flavin-dependent oxidoreductase [Kineococcus rhizosphaerae]PRY18463.1 luciferase family oxidoreductase group 1 [Kineococcus rhizosphaerae]
MSVPLSVLDLSSVPSGHPPSVALRRSVDLARAVEGMGYHRYWVAEHHNSPGVVSAPAVLVGAIAAATTTLRVGAGGVMLPNHSPLQVAETFRALEALHPGRVDLGLGRAPGTDGRTALALRRSREALVRDDFTDQLAELRGFVDGFEPGHPFAGIAAQPTDVPLPPVWLLGSSDHGAQLAAGLGTGYAYAGHFGALDPVEVLRSYRARFVPSRWRQRPHALLAVSVVVADTADRAAELAHAVTLSTVRLRLGAPGPLPTPEEAAAHRWTLAERNTAGRLAPRPVVGTAAEVVPVLADLVERSGADELLVVTAVHDPAERARSYELVAAAWGDAG